MTGLLTLHLVPFLLSHAIPPPPHFLRTYCVQVLSIFYLGYSHHLCWGQYHTHFADEKIEALRGSVTFPEMCSKRDRKNLVQTQFPSVGEHSCCLQSGSWNLLTIPGVGRRWGWGGVTAILVTSEVLVDVYVHFYVHDSVGDTVFSKCQWDARAVLRMQR